MSSELKHFEHHDILLFSNKYNAGVRPYLFDLFLHNILYAAYILRICCIDAASVQSITISEYMLVHVLMLAINKIKHFEHSHFVFFY
jgi:hypothetical protein